MKQNKLVIGVLVVIAVLFVLGLSSGVFRDDDNKDDQLSMGKVEKLKNGWIASLEGVMSPFRRKLYSGRLLVPQECKIDQTTYKLTKTTPTCTITITEKNGAAVQKAVLSVKTGNVNVRVSYPDDQTCATAARGSRVSLKKFTQSKAKFKMSKIKPGKVQGGGGGTSPQPLTLDVIYTPAGADEQKNRCEVTGDIDLTVLEKGGTLKLVCKGCQDNNRSVTVALE